ncbi:unnamed protein product [Enterobius vermicularis]|uniref:Protein kinase domain-containing protein n=1 Tax=Enterobius vermicularis TaxID=51028 RepID=A0A0N4VH16_ENTVE|nr:unnamed protein product [Enterobius vermicularis]
MDTDLHNVIKRGTILKDIHRRYIMCQLFRAVRFLHSGNVLHRDLKPSNVLLNTECRVKLADFGLARSLSQIEDYPEGQNMPELTEYVATRWYRSPEILLSAKRYTKGVDMWSLGCILGEMLRGKPLFPGTSTINQIERIMETIVKPSEADIKSIDSPYAEPIFIRMPQKPRRPLGTLIEQNDKEALDLIEKLLIFAPYKRLKVDECLCHPYVHQFHSPVDEPALTYDVMLPLPDHIQLSVDDYRTKLYELITMNKTNIKKVRRKKQDDRLLETSKICEPPSHRSTTKRLGADGSTPKQAPIAESECSDVDYDTARSTRRFRSSNSRVPQNCNFNCRRYYKG